MIDKICRKIVCEFDRFSKPAILAMLFVIILVVLMVINETDKTTSFEGYANQRYQCSESRYRNISIYTNYRFNCATAIVDLKKTENGDR